MRIRVVSETAAANYMGTLINEFKDIIEPLDSLYKNFPIDIDIVYRCRSAEIGFKSYQRFSKQKNILHIQISFIEDEVLKMLKAEQRFLFGHETYNYLSDAIHKRVKMGTANKFLFALKESMQKKGWLEEEIDYSNSLDEDF